MNIEEVKAALDRTRFTDLYPVYVPSYNRAGKSPLLNMLHGWHPAMDKSVHVIVRPGQVDDYRSAYPNFKFEVLPETAIGLGPAREWCFYSAAVNGHRRAVQVDDDLRKISCLYQKREDYMSRASDRVLGLSKPEVWVRSLAVACRIADHAFDNHPETVYGSVRNALFSGGEKPGVMYSVMKGSFPSNVLFWDTERFYAKDHYLFPEFYLHGEDIGLFYRVLYNGGKTFFIRHVAYDQDGHIASEIPLDPKTERGRQDDWDNLVKHYPDIEKYIRVGARNKLGGPIRFGIKWNEWNKDHGVMSVDVSPEEVGL